MPHDRRATTIDPIGRRRALDRRAWLDERRIAVEQDYTNDGGTYDLGYDPVTPVHRRFVERLIGTVPSGGTILDAPCGTGPYFGIVEAAGRRIVGADQSAGMLAAAHAKYPQVRVEKIGLQELGFDGEFDAAMTIDAMEHVPPEDWPRVLANLHRAVRPGSYLYLTVEQVDHEEIEKGYAEAMAGGLPAVRGEHVGNGTGGYHYYPSRDQVRRWLEEEGLEVIEEADEALDGYGYHHLLVRSRE
jgi:SAM-dependent methyltransferase